MPSCLKRASTVSECIERPKTGRREGSKRLDPIRKRRGHEETARRRVILSFIIVALFTAVQADETGWFHPRKNDSIPWDGLQIAKGATLDVPYAATPYEIADEMVRLADVKSDDVVYDLGCGDGRLVIAAVKKAGCRGVGIDIDPERIKESRQNAIIAGCKTGCGSWSRISSKATSGKPR